MMVGEVTAVCSSAWNGAHAGGWNQESMSGARLEVTDLNEKGIGEVPRSQLHLTAVSGKRARPAFQHLGQSPVSPGSVVDGR